jgi:hypothetical protein
MMLRRMLVSLTAAAYLYYWNCFVYDYSYH